MALRTLPPRVGILDTRRIKPPPKRADAILVSPEWKALRARVIAQRGYACEEPGCGYGEGRLYLDHIRERSDGGAELDPSNTQILCPTHHALKTARARAERMAKQW
jgi:5-methylcytosine-specific restriction protein A